MATDHGRALIVAELIANTHAAKRDMFVTRAGDAAHLTPWDLHHAKIDELLDKLLLEREPA